MMTQIKIETTKGYFAGDYDDCLAWLDEYQPSHASVVIGDTFEPIDADDANDWERALRAAVKVLGGTCRCGEGLPFVNYGEMPYEFCSEACKEDAGNE